MTPLSPRLLDVRHAAIEDFVREPGEAPFDVVFAPGGQVIVDGRPTPPPRYG
ncbi:MAG: hypothetical protein L0H64_08075 [Pseudonocardia sp.]|nr:hypothetical protein [Pseudonocardia sp.]